MCLKRSLYNLLVGVFCQVALLALGLVLPRLFLLNFGSEVNGIVTTINDLFVYIALLEAGIGAATVQALYRPIVAEDKPAINRILSATSIYYRRTGFLYFGVLVAVSVAFPFVVHSSLGVVRVMLLVFFTGIGNVINFLFQGKYRQLLLAEGKVYITTAISTAANLLASVGRILLICAGFDIVVVQGVYFVLSLLQMAFFEIYIRTRYAWLDLRVPPDFGAISQKNAVLVHQISGLVFRNTDVFLLTVFCGAKLASVYVIYNLIFNVIEAFINVLNDSVNAAMGQEYHRDLRRYARLFNAYELGYFALCFIACSTVYFIIPPFIRLYTAGVTDINYLVAGLPLLFSVMKFLNWGKNPCALTINYSGRFRDTRGKALLETGINLAVSLLLVRRLGLYGVVLGSIAAYLYSAIYSIWYTNKKLVDLHPKRTVGRWLLFIGCFFLLVLIGRAIPVQADSYLALIGAAVCAGLGSTLVYGVALLLFDRADCIGMVKTAVRFLRAKRASLRQKSTD